MKSWYLGISIRKIDEPLKLKGEENDHPKKWRGRRYGEETVESPFFCNSLFFFGEADFQHLKELTQVRGSNMHRFRNVDSLTNRADLGFHV